MENDECWKSSRSCISFLTERELEIKKFIPKPYWVIEALLKDNLKAIHEKEKFWNEKEAKNVYEK